MQEAEACYSERSKAGSEAGPHASGAADEGYAYQHALNLIRGILNADPQTRYKLSQVSCPTVCTTVSYSVRPHRGHLCALCARDVTQVCMFAPCVIDVQGCHRGYHRSGVRWCALFDAAH